MAVCLLQVHSWLGWWAKTIRFDFALHHPKNRVQLNAWVLLLASLHCNANKIHRYNKTQSVITASHSCQQQLSLEVSSIPCGQQRKTVERCWGRWDCYLGQEDLRTHFFFFLYSAVWNVLSGHRRTLWNLIFIGHLRLLFVPSLRRFSSGKTINFTTVS